MHVLGDIYDHVNDITVYLGRQTEREGVPNQKSTFCCFFLAYAVLIPNKQQGFFTFRSIALGQTLTRKDLKLVRTPLST